MTDRQTRLKTLPSNNSEHTLNNGMLISFPDCTKSDDCTGWQKYDLDTGMALTFTVLLLHSIGFNKNAWNREGSRIPRKCNFWEIWSKNRLASSPIPTPAFGIGTPSGKSWIHRWGLTMKPVFHVTLCSVKLTVLENSVFSSTLAWSPMASRSYQFESDF